MRDNDEVYCSECKWFDEIHEGDPPAPKGYGLCRFNPPVSIKPRTGVFPEVYADEWCSRYTPIRNTK